MRYSRLIAVDRLMPEQEQNAIFRPWVISAPAPQEGEKTLPVELGDVETSPLALLVLGPDIDSRPRKVQAASIDF